MHGIKEISWNVVSSFLENIFLPKLLTSIDRSEVLIVMINNKKNHDYQIFVIFIIKTITSLIVFMLSSFTKVS